MRLFKTYIFLILIILFGSTNAAEQDKYNTKIAVVDVEYILEHSLAITSIKKSISEISENIQKEVTAQEKELKKQESELIKLQNTITKEKFDLLVAKFNKKVSDIQKSIQSKRLALEQGHSEAIDTVHKTTITIIGTLAKKYNFNMVLPSGQVLFVTNELNITLEVISQLNDQLTTVPINYKKFLKS